MELRTQTLTAKPATLSRPDGRSDASTASGQDTLDPEQTMDPEPRIVHLRNFNLTARYSEGSWPCQARICPSPCIPGRNRAVEPA